MVQRVAGTGRSVAEMARKAALWIAFALGWLRLCVDGGVIPNEAAVPEAKATDAHSTERLLREIKYNVEFLITKVSLIEPRLNHMDVTIAKIERNIALAGISGDGAVQSRDTSLAPGRVGCVPSDTASLFKELSQITGQLRVISDQQRHCQDMLKELQNYTALSTNRIMNKIDEEAAQKQPSVSIQTTEPVIVSKTEARPLSSSSFNGGLKHQVLVPIVEVKNNHRSPSGSMHGKGSVFHADASTVAAKRTDRLSSFFADVFGERHNIAKHLRQVTDNIKKDTETPLAHGKEYVDTLAAEVEGFSDIKSAIAKSAATARNLQFSVFMDDKYAPLRSTASSLTRQVGHLERKISPLVSQFRVTVDSLKTVFGELSSALNGSVVGDAYYANLGDDDDLWR